MKWYIVHTYSGYENKARAALEERIRAFGKQEEFEDVLIPTENVVELVKGQRKTSKRKFFPGYLLVRMNLNEETWHIVKNTPKVSGFVGGRRPPPISEEEADRISRQMAEGIERPKPRVQFEKGENVRVVSGHFANFQGVVDEISPEKEKIRVLVMIFGRQTPVTLNLMEVEKS